MNLKKNLSKIGYFYFLTIYHNKIKINYKVFKKREKKIWQFFWNWTFLRMSIFDMG